MELLDAYNSLMGEALQQRCIHRFRTKVNRIALTSTSENNEDFNGREACLRVVDAILVPRLWLRGVENAPRLRPREPCP